MDGLAATAAGNGGAGRGPIRLFSGPPPSKQRSTSSAKTRVASGPLDPSTALVTCADPDSNEACATQGRRGSLAAPVALVRPQTANVFGIARAKTCTPRRCIALLARSRSWSETSVA